MVITLWLSWWVGSLKLLRSDRRHQSTWHAHATHTTNGHRSVHLPVLLASELFTCALVVCEKPKEAMCQVTQFSRQPLPTPCLALSYSTQARLSAVTQRQTHARVFGALLLGSAQVVWNNGMRSEDLLSQRKGLALGVKAMLPNLGYRIRKQFGFVNVHPYSTYTTDLNSSGLKIALQTYSFLGMIGM